MSVREIINRYLQRLRTHRFKKVKIAQTDVTILSNDCLGGMIYHDLGLKFLSPTINLYFEHHHFLDFVNDLNSFVGGRMVQIDEKCENGAPVAWLYSRDETKKIKIYFLHYSSFAEASSKWEERMKRINFDKIFVLITAKEKHEKDMICEYEQINYPKAILTDCSTGGSDTYVVNHFKKNRSKPICSFTNIFGKRGYDDFDFAKVIFNRDY